MMNDEWLSIEKNQLFTSVKVSAKDVCFLMLVVCFDLCIVLFSAPSCNSVTGICIQVTSS